MIAVFLVSTFLISWLALFLLPPAYSDLVMFVPGVMGIVLTIYLTIYKHEKLRTVFKLGSASNLLAGLVLSLAVFVLYLTISFASGFATFGLSDTAIEYYNGNASQAWIRFLTYGLPYMLGINLLFAIGEEIGWRGYLTAKIKSLAPNFWVRSLCVGIVWGLWHLPIHLLTGTPVINIFIFLLNVCLISICYTWLYEQKNAIWTTVLAHGAHNTFFNSILPMMTLTGGENLLWRGEDGLLVTICYSLVILYYILVNGRYYKNSFSQNYNRAS